MPHAQQAEQTDRPQIQVPNHGHVRPSLRQPNGRQNAIDDTSLRGDQFVPTSPTAIASLLKHPVNKLTHRMEAEATEARGDNIST